MLKTCQEHLKQYPKKKLSQFWDKKVQTKKLLTVAYTEKSHKSKKYICDLVINVSGPLDAGKIKNEIPIVKSLKQNGYSSVTSEHYDKDLCLIPSKLLEFIKSTQEKSYKNYEQQCVY